MKKLFILHLAIGAWMILIGLLAEMRPYVLLDVVLTEEQLQDEAVHDRTLELMQKGEGNDGFWFMVGGALLACTSIFGLRRGSQNRSPAG